MNLLQIKGEKKEVRSGRRRLSLPQTLSCAELHSSDLF
jgi:hypothetical protein